MKSVHSIVLPSEESLEQKPTIETLFMNQLGDEPLEDMCLRDEEAPRLSGCGMRGCRHKKTILVHVGPVMVLHVLRFTWDPQLRRPVKRNARVDFETILPPLDTGLKPYDLRAVVEHRGLHDIRSANAGHYVAYVLPLPWPPSITELLQA